MVSISRKGRFETLYHFGYCLRYGFNLMIFKRLRSSIEGSLLRDTVGQFGRSEGQFHLKQSTARAKAIATAASMIQWCKKHHENFRFI